MKNSAGWELVKGGVKVLDWNEVIRSPCPVLSLNEALLRILRDRVPKRTTVVRKVISLGMVIDLGLINNSHWICFSTYPLRIVFVMNLQ